MDNDFYAQLEIRLDEMATRIKTLEDALLALPNVYRQPDPSRPAGIVVAPGVLLEEPA